MIFQIDVENPCVIMSQDKSREFLHSGNDKDKFKVIKFIRFLAIPSHITVSLSVNFYLCNGTSVPRFMCFSRVYYVDANSRTSQCPLRRKFLFLLNYIMIVVT